MAEPLQGHPDSTDLTDVQSMFQRRMVRWDWEKALPHLLRETSYELLVVDCIDERIPLVRTDAGLVAFSLEAQRAGLAASPSERIDASAPGYAELWKASADRFLQHVDPARLVLNRAFWAAEDENGEDLRARFPVDASNECLAWMYGHIVDATGCRVIDYPQHLLVAKGDHQWGLSPFHYVDGFYEHFRHEFERIRREL